MQNALLVIDMQKDLCHHPERREKVSSMLGFLHVLIDTFHNLGYPIYYLCFALNENDSQFKRFGDRYCVKGTEGAEIIDELLPLRGEIIFKEKHSAFFETDLHFKLSNLGIQNLYLTGMQTQICIMTTAADAHFRGYNPIAIEECVLSTREEKKIQALKWIKDYVGEVWSLNNAIAELKNGK
ncbi:MAG: Peroxyureidoacrylate/ureidoacrylate amidohydrolase RutB [Haliscomenobacter sp.]|nr:Peroxyureidoacrylate/ureidoacrylate amidohydrolase RutB [Haliscomenobacter sp.]